MNEGTVDFSSLSKWEYQKYAKFNVELHYSDIFLLQEVLYEYQNEFVEFATDRYHDGYHAVIFSGSPNHEEAVLCFLHSLFKWKKTWPIRTVDFFIVRIFYQG